MPERSQASVNLGMEEKEIPASYEGISVWLESLVYYFHPDESGRMGRDGNLF